MKIIWIIINYKDNWIIYEIFWKLIYCKKYIDFMNYDFIEKLYIINKSLIIKFLFYYKKIMKLIKFLQEFKNLLIKFLFNLSSNFILYYFKKSKIKLLSWLMRNYIYFYRKLNHWIKKSHLWIIKNDYIFIFKKNIDEELFFNLW